jgi:hypothetical protein
VAEGGGFQAERRGRISIDQWRIFAISHRETGNVSQAARNAGISVKTAYRALADESHFPLYRKAREIAKSLVPEGVKDYEMLGVEAALAVADFAYFRERYFGRVATPWATRTATEITRLLATPHKEFVLVNEPPGVGKSTFWTLDFPAWLICRDRAIRIQIGSSPWKRPTTTSRKGWRWTRRPACPTTSACSAHPAVSCGRRRRSS